MSLILLPFELANAVDQGANVPKRRRAAGTKGRRVGQQTGHLTPTGPLASAAEETNGLQLWRCSRTVGYDDLSAMAGKRRRGAALCISLLLLASTPWTGANAEPQSNEPPDSEYLPAAGASLLTAGAILMTLVRSSTNFAAATAAVPNFQGWNWPDSEPCVTPQTSSWTGVACEGGMVVRM